MFAQGSRTQCTARTRSRCILAAGYVAVVVALKVTFVSHRRAAPAMCADGACRWWQPAPVPLLSLDLRDRSIAVVEVNAQEIMIAAFVLTHLCSFVPR